MMKWVVNVTFLFALGALSAELSADKLIYRPVNPSFGGHPSNGPNLLSEANAQNSYKDPLDTKGAPKTALESFSETLSNALQQNEIKRLADQAAEAEIGDTFSFGTISGTVITYDGGLAWLITDSRTNQSTHIQISSEGF